MIWLQTLDDGTIQLCHIRRLYFEHDMVAADLGGVDATFYVCPATDKADAERKINRILDRAEYLEKHLDVRNRTITIFDVCED